MNKRIMLSLPVPKISKDMEEAIASHVKTAYTASGEFLKIISPYELNLRGGLVDLLTPSWLAVDQKKIESFIDPLKFIMVEKISTIRLDNLLANRTLIYNGKAKKPSSVLKDVEGESEWKEVSTIFSSSDSIRNANLISDVFLPSSPLAFMVQWNEFISRLKNYSSTFTEAMKNIDRCIADFYGVRDWPENGIFIPWFR